MPKRKKVIAKFGQKKQFVGEADRPQWLYGRHDGKKGSKWVDRPCGSFVTAEKRFNEALKREKTEGAIRIVSPEGDLVRQRVWGGDGVKNEVEIYPLLLDVPPSAYEPAQLTPYGTIAELTTPA